MGRKDRPRMPVHLDSGGVDVSSGELAIILHGADSVVHRGGRSQLVKLLKGSRDKRVLELGLDADGSYGALSHLTLDERRRICEEMEAGTKAVDAAMRADFLSMPAEARGLMLDMLGSLGTEGRQWREELLGCGRATPWKTA